MSLYEFFFGFSDETKARHPHIFKDLDIDRRKCRRVVPMKVLCLSMGRTGTASMKAALEILGYPTSHGFDMHENPNDADLWMEATDAKNSGTAKKTVSLNADFWGMQLGHVSAVTDFPANMFGPELIAAYPDAKVILTERDVDKWYPSFDQALIKSNELPIVSSIFGQLDPVVKKLAPLVTKGMMRGQFRAGNAVEWRRNAKPCYTEHYASIRRLLADQPERLLNFEMEEGWGPLCEFLEQPVPDVKFPRVNEAAIHGEMVMVVMTKIMRSIVGKLMGRGGLLILVIVLVILVFWVWVLRSPKG
ncbi:hypothetical protein TI39_contig473g00004 [Zymoseptoria brevis]|uniref:P-loop containing nucleoside triphosphate hydrolase protein n=1 Tax=Zymoseptoria brevis TaxID=1047168 RepID=A0A0F4GNA5_9PEZI|nr:hypothetical protein TI39_contig473g00004 [Zymoseptoria brevis]